MYEMHRFHMLCFGDFSYIYSYYEKTNQTHNSQESYTKSN